MFTISTSRGHVHGVDELLGKSRPRNKKQQAIRGKLGIALLSMVPGPRRISRRRRRSASRSGGEYHNRLPRSPHASRNSTCLARREKSSSAIDVTSYACLPFYSGARQLSAGFLIVGCTVAFTLMATFCGCEAFGWRCSEIETIQSGDDVVLDGADRIASLSRLVVVPGRLALG